MQNQVVFSFRANSTKKSCILGTARVIGEITYKIR